MMMEYRAATRESSDNGKTGKWIRLLWWCSIGCLKIPKRYGRSVPTVDANNGFSTLSGECEECGIERHVPFAVSGRLLTDQMTGR